MARIPRAYRIVGACEISIRGGMLVQIAQDGESVIIPAQYWERFKKEIDQLIEREASMLTLKYALEDMQQ